MEENRRRNVQINFRVDQEEYDFIVEKAKISGKRNLTQYLRSMAIVGQIINIELDDIKILSANVGRFASSANQIAKRANATGNVYDEDIKDILCNSMKTLRCCSIVMHIHDELVIEADPGMSLDVLCEQMGRVPDWTPGLNLRADGYICDFYMKD